MYRDRETSNALGAVSLGIADSVQATMTRESSLDATSIAALVTIDAYPGESVSELASVLGLSHSGAVRVSQRLQDSGLITRRTGEDARRAALYATPAALDVIRPALRSRRVMLESLIAGLGPELHEALRAILRSFAETLTISPGAARRLCRLCQYRSCSVLDCPVNLIGAPDSRD